MKKLNTYESILGKEQLTKAILLGKTIAKLFKTSKYNDRDEELAENIERKLDSFEFGGSYFKDATYEVLSMQVFDVDRNVWLMSNKDVYDRVSKMEPRRKHRILFWDNDEYYENDEDVPLMGILYIYSKVK